MLSTCKQLSQITAPCTTELHSVPGVPPATEMAMLILFPLIIKTILFLPPPLQNILSEWYISFELYSCVGSTPCWQWLSKANAEGIFQVTCCLCYCCSNSLKRDFQWQVSVLSLKAGSVCFSLLAVNTKGGSVRFLHLQEK